MTVTLLVERYFDAVNRHDWEQLNEVFHPDVVVQHGASLSATGRDRALKLLAAIVAQFATHRDQPTRVLVDGQSAAAEISFAGTLPNGSAVSFDAVDIFDTDGVSITRVASWYDSAVVLELLRS